MPRRSFLAVFASILALGMFTPGPSLAGDQAGAVFTMSNGASRNRVVAWSRGSDGSLTAAGKVDTGGRGSGGGLSNQGALFLTPNGRWLYVVNPGSDDVSVFRVDGSSLVLTDRTASHGDRPISVTADGGLVYVLNAGGSGGIRGFRRSAGGGLDFISGSGRPLSGSSTDPAQVGFTPDGSRLVVTEKDSDRIGIYPVGGDGKAGAPTFRSSEGAEPFGFDFAPDGTLVTSEAGNHVEDVSFASSYRFGPGGDLQTVSGAVSTTETAACWTVVTPDGRFAYVTNTPDHSISGFGLADDGALTMLDANGVTAATGAGSLPLDLDSSADSRFLYVLMAGTDAIRVYEIGSDGSLTARPGVTGLPVAANGLVAR